MGDNTDEKSLHDVLFDIQYGELPPDPGADETNAEQDSDGASDKEPASEEQPAGESTETDGAEPKDDEAESGSESDNAEEAGEGEDKDDESESDGSDTIVLDGETFTLEEVRAWREEDRADRLRQADYTVKTQEVAAERAAVEERDKLLEEVLEDEIMGEMLKVHPKVLKTLVRDPQATRELLGDAGEVQKFWDQYELIAENPDLAERFSVAPSEEGPDEATAAAMVKQEAENILAIATHLDAGVDALAKDFEGVDVEAVKHKVLELAGMPEDPASDPEGVKNAFSRAFSLYFREVDGTVKLDDRLIRTQYEGLRSTAEAKAAEEAAKADEHNKQVDAQLNDKSGPPAGGGGDGAAPSPEQLEEADDLHSVLQDLWS